MKVILNQTVPKVGKQGQIVTVKDGFARNYLFPRGLAILADKSQIEGLNKRMAKVAEREAGTVAEAQALREKIHGQAIRIEGKVGAAAGKLFGAITSQDVADAVAAQLGVKLEKKQVALIEPIKRLGSHKVELDLHRQVDATISVEVFDPNAPVEVPAASATPSEPEALVATELEEEPELVEAE
jgi:large subunit ribosomal protein L9